VTDKKSFMVLVPYLFPQLSRTQVVVAVFDGSRQFFFQLVDFPVREVFTGQIADRSRHLDQSVSGFGFDFQNFFALSLEVFATTIFLALLFLPVLVRVGEGKLEIAKTVDELLASLHEHFSRNHG